MLPSLQLLEKVSQEIQNIPNRKKESKRGVHYGLFLLGYQAGLRVNEAVKFDLNAKTKKGLYRISKPKRKKERLVYIPKKVIRELRKNNWQPNQTNRFAFYHFLKKVKKELNISKSVELTPHTLRCSFATYQAEFGLPLPLLQKLLGHSSIRTTALYWRNIYDDRDNDTADILTGKKWLERQEPSQKEPPQTPTTEIFPLPKNPKPTIIKNKPIFTTDKPLIKPNLPPFTEIEKKPAIIDYQLKPSISGIPPKTPANIPLNIISEKKEITEQLPAITNQGEQSASKEQILLERIKQLEKQLSQVQGEKQSITKLLNKSEKENHNLKVLIQTEKQRVNHYETQLKIIAKSLYQWQKLNYYQQLEQEQENQAQIEQPLPFKPNK